MKGSMTHWSALFHKFVVPPSRRVVVKELADTVTMRATAPSVRFQINLPCCAVPPIVAEMPVQLRVVAEPSEVVVLLYGWGKLAPLPDWSGMDVLLAVIPAFRRPSELSWVANGIGVAA